MSESGTSIDGLKDTHKVKILIVEDEAIIAEDLRYSLEELGYTVIGICAKFDDAIEVFEREHPDFAILDINIKGDKDGIELAKEIKSRYPTPFIFLTSHADKETIGRAKAAGPNGYLVKPFQQDDLYASIEIGLSNFAHNKEAQLDQEADAMSHSLAIKDSIFVRDKYAYVKIYFKDILFIRADGNYIIIHTSESEHMIRGSLKDTVDLLPQGTFVRAHRSHIVNVSYISAILPSAVRIEGHEVPVQKELREKLLALIQTLQCQIYIVDKCCPFP